MHWVFFCFNLLPNAELDRHDLQNGREKQNLDLNLHNCKPFGVPQTFTWTLDLAPWTSDLGLLTLDLVRENKSCQDHHPSEATLTSSFNILKA